MYPQFLIYITGPDTNI